MMGGNGGVDLFEIDTSNGMPIWVQIRNRIAYLIESGYYKPGDSLPTIRELATSLGINYHTCNKAYTMLECDGYVTSRRGKGTTVSESFTPEKEKPASDVVMEECIMRCLNLGMSREDIGKRFQFVLNRIEKN